MFGWWRKREKPRFFIGTLAVVPRTGLKQYFELLDQFDYQQLDRRLRTTLEDIFALPRASEVAAPSPADYGIDVFVSAFQAGGGGSISIQEPPIFFFWLWRPKVTISCRLYSLNSGKTLQTFTITQRMSWRDYVRRIVDGSLPPFPPRAPMTAEDLRDLLRRACHVLLARLAKAV